MDSKSGGIPGVASSSSFNFTRSGTPILVVYFVCDSASELERWAPFPFWGFPALQPAFKKMFSELRNLLHIFLRVLGLFMGLHFFSELVTTGIRFFAFKSKKEKVLLHTAVGGQNGFLM